MNNNIIHGCLGILNFFLRVLLNVLLIQCAHWWDMYPVQHLQRNSIPPWPCIIPLFLAKKVLKYFYPIKRYNVLKCEFLLFWVTKWQKIQISKLDIFWVDRDISDFFFQFWDPCEKFFQIVTLDVPCKQSQTLAQNSWRHFSAKNARTKTIGF